jgi:tetratricopeptide (TPR) repeat protein
MGVAVSGKLCSRAILGFLLLGAGVLLPGAPAAAGQMAAQSPAGQPSLRSSAAAPGSPSFAQEFKTAADDYDAGRFQEAAKRLEELKLQAPKSFDVRELLGLTYAAQSQDAQAAEELEAAVHLKPGSAAARTNLAASLLHAGKPILAEEQFRKALTLEPRDFEANHDLGEFYIQSGKVPEARPFLEKAQQIDPSSYDNGYDLAQADFLTGRLAEAKQLIQTMIQRKNTAELHNQLAQIEEKNGEFVAAVNEYEIAAHMEPSEENLFDWGSELLLHRTYEPAIEIFQQGSRRYPNSPRMLIGLGMSLYSRGKYDDAVKALVAAADLEPSDARCYVFLSKAYYASPTQADEVIERFHRYAELEPKNALAQYYYAMSLWKGKRAEAASVDPQLVESLLQKSISLNESLPEAHFQLGNLYADQHEWEKSVPQYLRALQLDANLPDAHYRLGQDYIHTGKKDEAQAEFEIYQKQRAEHLAEVDKERAEVQQFVYDSKIDSKAAPATKP